MKLKPLSCQEHRGKANHWWESDFFLFRIKNTFYFSVDNILQLVYTERFQWKYYSNIKIVAVLNRHVCVCARAHVRAYVCTQPSLTFCNAMDCSLPWSSVHGIFPARILGKVNIGVGCCFLLYGIFWTQVSRTAGRLYPLSHKGIPSVA